MLDSLWTGVLAVKFVYNCFILLINENDLELRYVNVVNIRVFIRSMTINNELLQIYVLRYNSLNYQKRKRKNMLNHNILKIMGVGGSLPSKHIKRVNILQLTYCVLYFRYILVIMTRLYVGGVL